MAGLKPSASFEATIEDEIEIPDVIPKFEEDPPAVETSDRGLFRFGGKKEEEAEKKCEDEEVIVSEFDEKSSDEEEVDENGEKKKKGLKEKIKEKVSGDKKEEESPKAEEIKYEDTVVHSGRPRIFIL